MENASKALLIAGSILVVIVLIAVGMKVLNSTAGASESSQKTMDATAITNFNMQFVNAGARIGSEVTLSGSKTLALQQKVLASNAVNTTHKITGTLVEQTNGGTTSVPQIDTTKKYTVKATQDSNGYINTINCTEKT